MSDDKLGVENMKQAVAIRRRPLSDRVKECQSIITELIQTSRGSRPPKITDEDIFLALTLRDVQDILANDLFVPGDWVCPRCSFRQHNRLMDAKTGETFADQSKTVEFCPVDQSQMVQLTWKQEAEEANRAALDLLKQLEQCKAQLDSMPNYVS